MDIPFWVTRSTQTTTVINKIEIRKCFYVNTHVFGHLMQTADSLEKSLMLGKIEGRRRKGHQRMRWLDGITDEMT